MPSSRQFRVIGVVAIITILALYYISNGAKNTYESDFYQRTAAVIEKTKESTARNNVIEDERQRAERVERLRKEHDIATASAEAKLVDMATGQKPIVEEKNVAGRKKAGDKVVQDKPASDNDDGVAKVGNIGDHSSDAKDHSEVEHLMNDILKKGPIIIFSKSYCPHSKKAKHILQDLYQITPPPYVVELDHETLGPELQDSLLKSTGRRTVPNVLINGKSIGGGDDIQALHDSGKLADKVQAMGGKRIVSVVAKGKTSVKFKA